jgi:CRP/FNR family transcriptional regulator, cyclic AMP receptor protein
MASSLTALKDRTATDEVLAYLPESITVELRKGHIIYGPARPSTHLYLVVAGTIAISHISEDGDRVLLEIIGRDKLFGHSGFVGSWGVSEEAAVLQAARVLMWPIGAIEEIMMDRPRVGVLLLQLFAERAADLAVRLESFSLDTISCRLARSLLRLSERLGVITGESAVKMLPLTHYLLAQHVGTSREIVTHYMNHFRKAGYLRYSRREIVVYPDLLAASLVRTSNTRVAAANS